MMDQRYPIYHLIHLVGLASVLLALGAAALVSWLPEEKVRPMRKSLNIIHGIALLGMVVSGFGMLATLGIHGVPLWIWIKLAMWLLLGGSLALSYRMGPKQPLATVFFPLLICLVAMLAGTYKPG